MWVRILIYIFLIVESRIEFIKIAEIQGTVNLGRYLQILIQHRNIREQYVPDL